MSRSIRGRRVGLAGVGLAVLAAVAAIPLAGDPPVMAQVQPAPAPLSNGLQYVPADAALFVYAEAGKIWNHPVVQSFRKADAKTFDFLTGTAKQELGIAPEDVKSVVAFVPHLKGPQDTESFAVVLTFHKAFDKAKLQKGAESLLPKEFKPKVVAPDDRTAVVLMNLDEAKYGKPQPAKDGPLSAALKDAAGGKFAAVAGATLASLPDELRGDDVPASVRPFQPLFKAVTITATLDVEKNPTLDVRVKTGTAGQAVDCERALGALVALIQEELAGGVKELEPAAMKDMKVKDLIALLKAAGTSAKEAKFTTLGTETRLTVSIPTDLPFASAYLAARDKIQEAAALSKSANNLKQIGIAVHNYHDTYNNSPPAAVCDKTGKPLLSWRVLILPYVEQNELFKQFKLDEPWDSANNKKLLAKMPPVYALPGKTQIGDTDTYYRVFVGGGAGWDWVMGTKLQNITDGTSNTLMCVTAAEAVPWTKPDELEFNAEKDMGKLIGLVVNGKAQVSLFDGSVRTLKKIPPKETLNALITKGGGEVINFDFE